MSEQSQGPGWWQASDGKWYPPEQAPPGYVPPTTSIPSVPPTQPFGPPLVAPITPPKSGLGRGPIIGIVAGVIAVLLVAFLLVGRDDGKKNASATSSSSNNPAFSGSSSASSSDATSSSSSGVPVDVPPGFKVLSDDGEGVSIAVPRDFVRYDIDNAASNASDLASDNPDLQQFLGSAAAFAGNTVISARSPGLTPAALIVAKSPQSFDVEDPSLGDQLKQTFSDIGPIVNVDTANETLPAGPALRLDVALEVNRPDSSTQSVHETMFFVNAKGSTWVILGVTSQNDQSSLFEQIADTFRVN